tara:strand:- start:2384 stop:3466 length:1083 start_codon:yes stop_codon:yes gene_type:complete
MNNPNIDSLFDFKPYSLEKSKKELYLNELFFQLTKYHYANCYEYKCLIDSMNFNVDFKSAYVDIPFIPVRLFKMYDLLSVPKKLIFKTMMSSGTSGQAVSKVFLDKKTSLNQSKALTKIISTFLGSKRSPMLIIDSEEVLKNRNMFSARGAGILGFSIFGKKRIYALDKNMKLKVNEVTEFLNQNQNQKIFLFGFTFMIYKYFIQEIMKNKLNFNLTNAVLIHGGGWKKLENNQISSKDFRKILKDLSGLNLIHDYYGMVEQTGSIYMECENGYLHAPVFSDVIIRRSHDFSEASFEEPGIIQTLSTLPKSYPGHSLLTEDEGVLLGEDDCKCGRNGKYFTILGRIKNAEIRGCSDTYGG